MREREKAAFERETVRDRLEHVREKDDRQALGVGPKRRVIEMVP